MDEHEKNSSYHLKCVFVSRFSVSEPSGKQSEHAFPFKCMIYKDTTKKKTKQKKQAQFFEVALCYITSRLIIILNSEKDTKDLHSYSIVSGSGSSGAAQNHT